MNTLQAGYWREYADQQMSCAGEAVVKSVFSRCLLTCLSVDLWRSYLNFIKRVGAGGATERSAQALLARMGQARHVWFGCCSGRVAVLGASRKEHAAQQCDTKAAAGSSPRCS